MNYISYNNAMTVVATPGPADDEFIVVWRSGFNKQGKVTVKVTAPLPLGDKAAAAELSVSQYLLEELQVFGTHPPLKGILFEFGSATINKLHKQNTDKYHLYPYCYFLNTKFSSAVIETSSDVSWLLPRANLNVAEMTLHEPKSQFITSNALGKLAITKHVVDQFIKRMNNIEPHVAWKLLTQYLNSSSLVLFKKSASSEKYDHEATRYLDSSSQWCFVIGTNERQEPAVLSAYIA